MSYYVLKNKHAIPGFLFWAVASWAIVLAFVTVALLFVWGLEETMHIRLLTLLPGPLTVFLDICGAYAAIGGLCLYLTMWVYWIAVERSSFLARAGWLLALLLGLHIGALVYAFAVWRKDIVKVSGPQPIRGISTVG
jgi:hypothetical protein